MSSRSIGAEPTTSMTRSTSPSSTRAMSPMISRRARSERDGPAAGSRSNTSASPASSAVTESKRAVAGRGVVAAPAHAFEDRVAVEPLGQEAGEPAVAAEERGAGIAGARPALVAVGIGDDADAVVLLEGVAHDPLERAPGRVHLDCGLHGVVRVLDVGVAAADVGDHHAVLAREPGEQRVRVVRVRRLVDHVGRVGDLGVRGAVDGLALVAVVHVAVAADGGVGRPLVAGDAHEPAGLVELAGERVELAPERAGDLEVVALVAHDVEEGLVAAELEVFARRVGAERLVGLAVRVAPEVHERQCPGRRRAGDWSGTAPRRSRRARGW